MTFGKINVISTTAFTQHSPYPSVAYGFLVIVMFIIIIIIIVKIKIYETIILPVVLYGCETWSLTLREESRLRVFENRILRRIFGPKRDENGEWRRHHNEELHSLYY